MQYRTFGRTGLKVSIVGFGASGNFGNLTGDRDGRAHRLLKCALDLGVNLIDTAANYGESEAILGPPLPPEQIDHLRTIFMPRDENDAWSTCDL